MRLRGVFPPLSCHGTWWRQPPASRRGLRERSPASGQSGFLRRHAAQVGLPPTSRKRCGLGEVTSLRRSCGAGESPVRPFAQKPLEDGRAREASQRPVPAPRAHTTHFQVERVLLLFDAADVPTGGVKLSQSTLTEHTLLGRPHSKGPAGSPRTVGPSRFADVLQRRSAAPSAFSPNAARGEKPLNT